ncbi:hypothetical protein J2Z83_002958 [Virgibacillus natechei]|uniref:Uncharacterized protein n=1 Tax=Virgibacillus natechei TaxID=1216297 RepID=A0ABS4IIN9_9BACI|nr:hypothetical protein [Virgibacillus natechei]
MVRQYDRPLNRGAEYNPGLYKGGDYLTLTFLIDLVPVTTRILAVFVE